MIRILPPKKKLFQQKTNLKTGLIRVLPPKTATIEPSAENFNILNKYMRKGIRGMQAKSLLGQIPMDTGRENIVIPPRKQLKKITPFTGFKKYFTEAIPETINFIKEPFKKKKFFEIKIGEGLSESQQKIAEIITKQKITPVGKEYRLPFTKTIKFAPKGKEIIPNSITWFIESVPKYAIKRIADYEAVKQQKKGEKVKPLKFSIPTPYGKFTPQNLGFSENEIKDTLSRTMDAYEELQRINPNHKYKNAALASLTVINDVFEGLAAADMISALAKGGLSLTQYDAGFNNALKELKLTPEEISSGIWSRDVDALKNNFFNNFNNLADKYDGILTKEAGNELRQLLGNTQIVADKMMGNNIPLLSGVEKAIQNISKTLLSPASNLNLPAIGLTTEEVGIPAIIDEAEKIAGQLSGENLISAKNILKDIKQTGSISIAGQLLDKLKDVAGIKSIPKEKLTLLSEIEKQSKGTKALVPYQIKLRTGEPIFKGKATRKATAIKKLQQEKEELAKQRLGFTLKGKPKDIFKLTKAEKLKLMGKEPATLKQKQQAHIIAKEKGWVSAKGKAKPQYRRLAEGMTGKKSLKEMTQQEAKTFIEALDRIPKPTITWKGDIKPVSIPISKQIVTDDFFKREFKKPTHIGRLFTPQWRYGYHLGVGDITEKLEQKYQQNILDTQEQSEWLVEAGKQLSKDDSLIDRALSFTKNVPTLSMQKAFDLMNDPKADFSKLPAEERQILEKSRKETDRILDALNDKRVKQGKQPIPRRQGYITHTFNAVAQEEINAKHPFPEFLKDVFDFTLPSDVFDKTALRRTGREDGLIHDWHKAMKAMYAIDLRYLNLSDAVNEANKKISALITNADNPLPADTKKWLNSFIRQAILKQPSPDEAGWDAFIQKLKIDKAINYILKPFGRSLGTRPAMKLFQAENRLIHLGGIAFKFFTLPARNLLQQLHNVGMYGFKASLQAYKDILLFKAKKLPMTLTEKTRFPFENLDESVVSKLEKAGYSAFQASDKFNVLHAKATSYHWAKNHGWSEEEILKEMEFGIKTTQYSYLSTGMPQMYNSLTGKELGIFQSWWQNFFFNFNRELIIRASGKTGYGKDISKEWGMRLGILRYWALALAISWYGIRHNKKILKYVGLGTTPTGETPAGNAVSGLLKMGKGFATGNNRTTGSGWYDFKRYLKLHLPITKEKIKREIDFFGIRKKNKIQPKIKLKQNINIKTKPNININSNIKIKLKPKLFK